ncbi:DNA-processing protein DprA [Gorillibacterium sp. sgz5001074]|uniref:DNA-processing protein DprA n=1 Tax=Gorillibacterium sp. sgz5001074 TaxID=3446695 RepID=UPI003F67CEAE
MKNHEILVTLHELEGIGWKTIRLLWGRYPELQDVLGASVQELRSLGLPQNKAAYLASRLTEQAVAAVSAKYEGSDIVPLTRCSPEYPELLSETGQPPWVLYSRGRRELLDKPCIAVVGTRTPTIYGKRAAERFARDLSEAGVCVVSGLARGIDGAAHQSALHGSGSTIAVLGCGIDVIYPREHASLYHNIAEKGLILSEYPPGMSGAPGMFPQRNRIIAGVSLGTLVVEAALQSGSLITADLALEESRDVFAVPGPLTSPKSAGTNRLIQKGAQLVTGAHDLMAEYKHIVGQGQHLSPERGGCRELTPEEARIMELLGEGPCTIDDLVERSQTNFGLLHAILLSLQMKDNGQPVRLENPCYIRVFLFVSTD